MKTSFEITESDRTYGKPISVDLKPGTAWAIYMDDGPGGPCGQSMRTTCPHAILCTWPNEDAMREAMKDKNFGRNKKAKVMFGVIDSWSSPGVLTLAIHKEESEPEAMQDGA
jgi:hypothetical protein